MGESKKETRELRLKYAFGSNSKVEELHVTSDDQMFTNGSDAKAHAKSLEDETVDVAKRSDYIKVQSVAQKIADEVFSERSQLIEKHVALFGKKPSANASIDKIKEKVEAEEKRIEDLKKAELSSNEPSGEDSEKSHKSEGSQTDPE